MIPEPSLKSAKDVATLADLLSRSPAVSRLDQREEREPWTIAHALSDLEESFRKVLFEQLLALRSAQDADIEALLLDIGEELRHVLYHIHDPRFFRYLTEPDCSSKPPDERL